jgi:hypothetical protein
VSRGRPAGMTFKEADAQRVVDAAWGVQHLLPHPDDVASAEDAARLREFHRAIVKIPPIARVGGGPKAPLVEDDGMGRQCSDCPNYALDGYARCESCRVERALQGRGS